MPHDQKAMESYYRARAAEYDQVYLKPERQDDLAAIRAWLPKRLHGRSILEIACGTGYWTQVIAPVAEHLLALDAAPETLEIARSRGIQGKVRFVSGDAYALPRELAPFDAAFAGFWFSHVPKARWREFLSGLGQRLRPGARVILLDNRFVEGSSTPIAETDTEGNTFQCRRLADGSMHRVLKNFPGEEELRAAIDGIGSDFRFLQWPYYWAIEYAVGKH